MATRKPSPRDEILAGFFSGVADALASHPLDQVKTQMQINPGKNGAVLASLRQQVADGGISSELRCLGLTPVFCGLLHCHRLTRPHPRVTFPRVIPWHPCRMLTTPINLHVHWQ